MKLKNGCKSLVLNNGLKCLIYSDKCFKSANISLYVHCGSRNENVRRCYGISHLIEHMLFKGTTKRLNSNIISQDVYKLGGNTNAFTGIEMTGYYINVPCKNISKAIEILSDMIFNSVFKEDDIKLEKKVVINELKQRESNHMHILTNMVNKSVFNGTTLGKSIGGTSKSVNDVNRNDILSYLRKFYFTRNMTLVIVSDLGSDAVAKIARKYFSKQSLSVLHDFDGNGGNGGNGGSELCSDFYLQQSDQRVSLKKSILSHAFICFSFPMDKMIGGSVNFTSCEVLGNVLAGNMMSRLFTLLRVKMGLVYNVKFMLDMYHDSGIFMITLSTHNDNQHIQQVIQLVMKEIGRIKTHGISNKELKVFKDYMIGNWTMSLNDANEMAEFFGVYYILTGKINSKEGYLKDVGKVSAKDIRRVARQILRKKALNLCVLAK